MLAKMKISKQQEQKVSFETYLEWTEPESAWSAGLNHLEFKECLSNPLN